MANKRALKKRIHQICGEAAVEVLVSLPAELAHKIVIELARLQSESLANISFSFDRSHRDFANEQEYNKARHTYTAAAFKSLNNEFNTRLQGIVKEINTSLKSK